MRKGTRSNSSKTKSETGSVTSPLAPPSTPPLASVVAEINLPFPPPPPPPPAPVMSVPTPTAVKAPPPPVAQAPIIMPSKGAKGFLPPGTSLAGVYSVGMNKKKVINTKSIEDESKFLGMLKPGELTLLTTTPYHIY